MASETPNDVLRTYTSDMHSLVSHGLRAVERQIDNLKKEDHPEAYATVQEIARTLRSHENMLEARCKSLGSSATKPVKDAVSAVAGVVAGLINAVRPEEAAKSLRDDETFLAHAGAAYLMLFTTAAGLGDRETENLARTGYQDVARLSMEVDHLLPKVVLQELKQDGLTVGDVSIEAIAMMKQAWNRDTSQASATI